MKKRITLTKETIETLRILYTQIDEENKKSVNECDIDIITENQYKILDTIKELIFK